MSSFVLRFIAIICMLLDHLAHCFVPMGSELYMIMRIIGRLAFPVFAFLICEGALHTRSFSKYAMRLGAFALLSEIPFDLAFHGDVFDMRSGQNVFFTLLLGLLSVGAMKELAPKLLEKLCASQKLSESTAFCALIASPLLFGCCILAHWLNTDYGWAGVLMIIAFYVFKDNRTAAAFSMAAINFAFLAQFSIYNLQFYAVFAAFSILAYNGQAGSKKLKWLFYSFYPLHLIAIWLVQVL